MSLVGPNNSGKKLSRRQFTLGGMGVVLGTAPRPRTDAAMRAELEQAAATLAAERVAARREGLPLTVAELRLDRAIPVEQDAAPRYAEYERRRQAIEKAERGAERARPGLAVEPILRSSTERLLHAIGGQPGAVEDPEFRQAMERRRPLLDLAWQIAARPRCRPEHDWARMPDVTLDRISTLRDIARVLGAHAVLEASQGTVLTNAPLDEFDGKPLRYRREAAGFRAWSAGRNQKDEGGAPGGRWEGPDDLVVTLP